MAARKKNITRTARAGGETLTVAMDPLAAVRTRVDVMHSRVHGAQKSTRRYERRQNKVDMRQSMRAHDWD